MAQEPDGLKQALATLNEDEFNRLFQAELAAGRDPLEVLETCREGMEIVGQHFEANEYFVTELIMAAELFKTATSQLESRLSAGPGTRSLGTVVMGTVQGDIHDIGKDIVVGMLRGAGFMVHDLGVDVAPQAFVDKARETGAGIVGLSGLLTLSWDSMKETVNAFASAGLRDRVKLMIGGGMTNEMARIHTGADVWGQNAQQAVRLARQFAAVEV